MRRLRWPVAALIVYWLVFLGASVGAHVALILLLLRYAPTEAERARQAPPRPPPEYVRVDLPPTPSVPEAEAAAEQARAAERPKPLDLDGQIVEVAKPPEERRPDEAEYLAQYDTTVPKETRAPQFAINPEVVAPEFSDERAEASVAEVEDLGMDEDSTGATVRQEDETAGEAARLPGFDPRRDGVLGSVPSLSRPYDSPWTRTNRDGLEAPARASPGTSRLAGAPQNDRLFEDLGDGTYLNTKELLYAEYLLRIRRLVNFYWAQNLDNLPSSVRIAKPEYTTVVEAVLDGNGALERLDVTDPSGLTVLDDCVVRAYKIAGPFPNPPAGLIASDGRVYLPTMTWTVTFSQAENRLIGVDPNAGVQFPGLYKSPR